MKPYLIKLFFLMSFLLAFNAYGNSSMKGSGTPQDPYQIVTCENLQDIRQNLSANYVIATYIDCSDTQYWNLGEGFIPIGGANAPFTGSLDGQNHTIANLYIDLPTSSGVGLFGLTLQPATISNINLSNVNITGASDVGGLIGTGNQAIVSNISVTGRVTGENYVGGLVGTIQTISNSSANATVTGTTTYTGGLVGIVGNILNSVARGNVTGGNMVGGLSGGAGGNIVNSYSTGNVVGSISVGGLIGQGGTISNSYAIGNATGTNMVGGLVGYLSSTISNSYAVGKVTGNTNTGGLVGMGYGTFNVSNSYYDIDTSGQHDIGKGTPISDTQMKQQATFTGWDFENTWAINEGNYYPVMPWDAGKENLYDAQTQLQAFEKQHQTYYQEYGSFQGITYNVSDNNIVSILQTPNIWGQSLASFGYIPWDNKTSDFSDLPDCTANPSICPTNTQCLHLNAFNNGITGQNIKRCVSSADQMVDNIYEVMTSATTSIDITTLEPFPDGRFLAAMRNAITWLAVNNKNITIRVLGGVALPALYNNQDVSDEILQEQARAHDNQFLQQLIQDIPSGKVNNIIVYVGSMRTCAGFLSSACLPSSLPWLDSPAMFAYRFSWNHSKIIDADGRLSLVGGENWWTNSYLVNNAINDVNLKVDGPASLDATHFVNQLWNYICMGGNHATSTIATSISWINGQSGTGCLSNIPLPPTPFSKNSDNTATLMAIGRFGAGMIYNKISFKGDEPANQSEIVRNLLFKGAVNTIRIAQQNTQGLPLPTPYSLTPAQFERNNDAGNVYDILTNLVLQNGDVYIVESNYGAVDGAVDAEGKSVGVAYYTKSKLTDDADTFLDHAKILQPGLSDAAIRTLLCQHLHLAGIRYSNDDIWPNQIPIGNHSKVWIVDDKVYYVGSHNIYPANLQEYGYIVGGQPATQSFMQQFWSPLWQYSQKAEISGSEISSSACYYNIPKNRMSAICAGKLVLQQSPLEVSYSGCSLNSKNDTILKFITAPPDNGPYADALICKSYAAIPKSDIWTGCGKGQIGEDNYQVGY